MKVISLTKRLLLMPRNDMVVCIQDRYRTAKRLLWLIDGVLVHQLSAKILIKMFE